MNLQPLRLPDAAARMISLWHASSLSIFLNWWRCELMEMLPKVVREMLVPARRVNRAYWHEGILLDERGQRWMTTADEQAEQVLLLPTHLLLIRNIQLPMGAAANLHSVLAFEMDKYTPFRAEQVYFASQRLESNSRTELEVCWVIILRDRLDALLDQAAYRFDRVDGLDANDQPLNINLAPEPRRRKAKHTGRNINRALALLAIGLTVIAMQSWVGQRQAALAARQAQVSSLRQQLQLLQTSNQQHEEEQRAGLNIEARKRQTPPLSAVLGDLSGCIPADTWLSQLEISAEGRATLNGQSREASELISSLKHCVWLADPQFEGAIQTDPSTAREGFYLRASLGRREPEHAPAQTP